MHGALQEAKKNALEVDCASYKPLKKTRGINRQRAFCKMRDGLRNTHSARRNPQMLYIV